MTKVNKYLISMAFLFLLFPAIHIFAQKPLFDRQDSLRGSITSERVWWDLTWYHLQVTPQVNDSSLFGSVEIGYSVLESSQKMQIDLQPPMQITKVEQNGDPVEFLRDGNVYYLNLTEKQHVGHNHLLTIHYEGKPVVSKRPPWDGGLVWRTDSNGNPFIATACQGEGASLWWPCKDHMYDEPDSMRISIIVPKGLIGVANGRLERKMNNRRNKTIQYDWFVANPINNYGVNMNVGDYIHFSETYDGIEGALDCDYYVLRENELKAKEHFTEVPRMLEAFEYWFGPYPFYADGFKLVEVPYPGMEHQSSVTYGNLYDNGFMGLDVSHTGWGFQFDFIIIHESGHEWFANSITYKDIADMWIHEGFTAYSESLFTEYFWGKDAGYAYVRGTRANISNNRPIIGEYDVNHAGSGDMYAKGANMLHTLRQWVNNDSTWRAMLLGLNQAFYHQTVDTRQIEKYISDFFGIELVHFFDQYLRDNRLPVLEYYAYDNFLYYRWSNCLPGFNMPLDVTLNDEVIRLQPTTKWQHHKIEKDLITLLLNPNYYVAVLNLQGTSSE